MGGHARGHVQSWLSLVKHAERHLFDSSQRFDQGIGGTSKSRTL
jgi:hypothetical protein